MQETRVQSLGWEVLLEKGMAIHSSILAWGFPWTEKAGGLQSMGSQRVRHDWATNTHTHTQCSVISCCLIHWEPSTALITPNVVYVAWGRKNGADLKNGKWWHSTASETTVYKLLVFYRALNRAYAFSRTCQRKACLALKAQQRQIKWHLHILPNPKKHLVLEPGHIPG